MQHRPKSVNTDKWCDVVIQEEQITIRGGSNRKSDSAECIRYQCADNVQHTFVALHKESAWFVKGVGGEKTRKGDLKAVNVLQMLRQKIVAAEWVLGDAEPCPAVAGADSQSSAADMDDDPMESMISRAAVADSIGDVVKRISKKRKVDRACVQEVVVPTSPTCLGAASRETTTIFVYMPREKRKNAVIHLRIDCLGWLLSYAADELACQGVSLGDTSSDATPQRANCAVDNVWLEWSFSHKMWEAVFLAGHAQGEVVQFGATDVTPALYKKLRKLDLASCWYSKTNMSDNKKAAKEYIVLWCKAIQDQRLAEHNAVFASLLVGRTRIGAADGGASDGDDSDGEASDAEAVQPSEDDHE